MQVRAFERYIPLTREHQKADQDYNFPLFVYKLFYQNLNKNEKFHPRILNVKINSSN